MEKSLGELVMEMKEKIIKNGDTMNRFTTKLNNLEQKTKEIKEYVILMKEENKEENELLKKQDKHLEDKKETQQKLKYVYNVKEQLISISISFKSHNFKIVDYKYKIIRYPIYHYDDVIFNNEEEANKHIEKRKKK